MDETTQVSQIHQVERNLQTEAIHRHEVLWQITIPLVIGVILFMVFFVWAIVAGAEANSQAADVAVMWLLLLPILITLLLAIVFGALFYGVWKLMEVLPGYLFQIQNFFLQVRIFVRNYADKSVEPFLKVHSASASHRAFWRSLFKKGA